MYSISYEVAKKEAKSILVVSDVKKKEFTTLSEMLEGLKNGIKQIPNFDHFNRDIDYEIADDGTFSISFVYTAKEDGFTKVSKEKYQAVMNELIRQMA